MPGSYGTTVGLLGASRIAKMVAERLRGFDLQVLISDPYLTAAEAAELGAELVDNDTLFRRSDILSVHAPLIPETVGLVDARLLGLLKDGSVLINTARGKIIDAEALLRECVLRPDRRRPRCDRSGAAAAGLAAARPAERLRHPPRRRCRRQRDRPPRRTRRRRTERLATGLRS